MASEAKVETIGVEEARREIAGSKATAVDVRSEEEWNEGRRIPGAIHLPDGDSEDAAGGNLPEPEHGSRLLVITKDGNAAAESASRLIDQGYDAVAVDGGMDDWLSENFNVQPTEDPDEETALGAG
jgi:rhodanese-related sulfurtransferase